MLMSIIYKKLFRGFPVSRNEAARIIVNSNVCEGLSGEIRFIESVQLVVILSYPKRGDIQIAMKSPLGIILFILHSIHNIMVTSLLIFCSTAKSIYVNFI